MGDYWRSYYSMTSQTPQNDYNEDMERSHTLHEMYASTPQNVEAFENTNPRATLLDGYIYFRQEDVNNFLLSYGDQREKEVRAHLVERLGKIEKKKAKIGFENPDTKMQQIKQRVFAQGFNQALDQAIDIVKNTPLSAYKEEVK